MNMRWIESGWRTAGLLAAAGAAASLLGCTTMGTGTGSLSPGNTPVAFSWTSKDGGITGTMAANVDKSTRFSGPFLQVTRTVRTDAFEPMWTGWSRGWNDWGFLGPTPDDAFTTRYSGRVLANLTGPDGKQLRCRFRLDDPVSGMGGGGQGDCQFTGGRSVSAVFARA